MKVRLNLFINNTLMILSSRVCKKNLLINQKARADRSLRISHEISKLKRNHLALLKVVNYAVEFYINFPILKEKDKTKKEKKQRSPARNINISQDENNIKPEF
jgi:hypothetical protein